MDEFRKQQIEALIKAADFCEKGGCDAAIPIIKLRIRWLKEIANFYD